MCVKAYRVNHLTQRAIIDDDIQTTVVDSLFHTVDLNAGGAAEAKARAADAVGDAIDLT